MKTAAVIAIMLIGFQAEAQTAEQAYFGNPARYENIGRAGAGRAYLAALASGNDGVVESALAHVAMMKLVCPDAGCPDVRETVERLTRTAGTQELQYKAYLTLGILDRPELFNGLERGRYGSADELFGAAASRLAVRYATR
jgi:hypothetical protein